jgi:hypothetical protein
VVREMVGQSLKGAEKDTPQTRTDSQAAQWRNPNSFFLMVCSAVGVCFCGCVLSFRDDRYIGIRAAVASVTFAVHIL